MPDRFLLQRDYQPTGDQPAAIDALVDGILRWDKGQTLLGVTGSGKTFTMANVIAACGRPTLILEPNTTLAAQIAADIVCHRIRCQGTRGNDIDGAVDHGETLVQNAPILYHAKIFKAEGARPSGKPLCGAEGLG